MALHAQPPIALPLHTRACRFLSLREGFSKPPLSTQKYPPVKHPTHACCMLVVPLYAVLKF